MPIAQIISFPKSGRTWLRYMLVEAGVNDIKFHHDGFEFNDGSLPEHNFDVDTRLEKYGPDDKVIFVHRDPRDVIVSLYHQVTGRFKDFFDYQGGISEFIRDDYFGAHVLKQYGEMWREVLSQRDFLEITYEDMHKDTFGALQNVFDYLTLDIPKDTIEKAVNAGQIKNMREVEMSGTFDKAWLRPRNGFTKVRKGKIGGYKNELCPEDAEYLVKMFEGIE